MTYLFRRKPSPGLNLGIFSVRENFELIAGILPIDLPYLIQNVEHVRWKNAVIKIRYLRNVPC